MSVAPKEGAVMGDDSIKCETNEGLKVLLDLTVLFHIDRNARRRSGANWGLSTTPSSSAAGPRAHPDGGRALLRAGRLLRAARRD